MKTPKKSARGGNTGNSLLPASMNLQTMIKLILYVFAFGVAVATTMVEQQVLAACAQLYGGATEGSKIREANAFLTEWQITDQAWEVANTILQNKTSVVDTSKANVATAVFCTQTLRTKVQLDVNDLDSREKCEYMRSMLFQHMAKFRDAPALFSAALKQLCLALCGLAIHMDELWPDFIESLLNVKG
eukprot:g16757.t1